MLANGREQCTWCVFQVGNPGQINMLPTTAETRPTYYDLVVQVAIVRPGPNSRRYGCTPYLKRRHGLETCKYPNQAIQRVLERDSGVPSISGAGIRAGPWFALVLSGGRSRTSWRAVPLAAVEIPTAT